MTCSQERIGPKGGGRADHGLRGRMPSLPFIWWALGLALTAGFAQGTALLLTLAFGYPIGLWWIAAVQAHGHVQLFGWGGLFALAVGLYFLPRLRGCPPPSPRAVRAAACLLGGGLALRAVTQPIASAVERGGLRTVLDAGLVLSGPLELAGAGLAVGSLVAVARKGPPLSTRTGLVAVLPFALAFFVAMLLGLAINALALVSAVAAESALLPASANWTIVHLGLVGMLVPISAAISARTFPLYLRLRVPPGRALHAIFALFLLGFLLRSSGPFDLSDAVRWLPAFGALIEGAAMLALVAIIDVPLLRTRRVPPGREAAPLSENRAAEWLILSAYAWLMVAGLILIAEGLAGWALAPRPPIDAERHALGAGLVTLLILGMAVRLLPGFAGRRLYSAGLVWATVWLGNAAALLRVVPLFLPSSRLSVGLLALSGLLALAAVVSLTWNLWRTLRGPVSADQGRGRPGAVDLGGS
jgi:uncharacterized protein involved in response to NO